MKKPKITEAVIKRFKRKRDINMDSTIETENLRSFTVATFTVAVVDLLFFILTLNFLRDSDEFISKCVGSICCSIACFATSALLWRYLKKAKESYKPKKSFTALIIVAGLYLLMSSLSIHVDIINYRRGDQMLFFYIVQVCFLLFFNMRPIRCLFAFMATFGCLCGHVIALDGGRNFNFSSFGIFFALAVVGNAAKYNTRVLLYQDHKKLECKEKENEAVVSHSGKYVVLFDLKANVLYRTQKIMDLFGLPPETKDPINSLPKHSFVTQQSITDIKRFYSDMQKRLPCTGVDLKLKTIKGKIVWHHGEYTLLTDEYGEYDRSVVSFSDVTEQMEQKLLHDRRIHEIVSLAHDCDFYLEGSIDRWVVEKYTIMSDKAKNIPFVNYGCKVDEIVEGKWKYLVCPEDFPRVEEFFNKGRLKSLYANGIITDKMEFRLVSDKAEWCLIELCLLHSESGNELNFFALFRDTSTFHSQYDKLVIKATTDDLTGLYNRDTTMGMIEEFLSKEGAQGTHALVMFDLDNFKKLNDSLGHQVGDDALRKVGEYLSTTFRKSDICGRIGGDEFFAFLKDISIEKVIYKVKNILYDMQMTFTNEQKSVTISTSVGISMYHGEGVTENTLKTLYAKADAALYKSKVMGKNTFTFADEIDALAASSSSSSSSSSAFLKNEAIAYNLRGLFENLASGIAIFQGEPDVGLVPVFCNEKLLDLLEIKREDFYAHMGFDNQYGMHPDDLERSEYSLRKAKENGMTVRDTVRLKKGTGEYCYVTVFCNPRVLDDGNVEWYVIYSEAKEAEQLRRIREERYSRFSTGYTAASEHSDGYIVLNITQDRCGKGYISDIPYWEINTGETVDRFLGDLAKNIAYADIHEKFLSEFGLEKYKKYVDEGIYRKEMKLPCILKGKEIRWYNFVSEVALNPSTGDIEAFAILNDIDNEVRLGSVVERMLKNEYELVAQIDVQNGYITSLGEISEKSILKKGNTKANYREEYGQAVENVISPEYLAEALESMSLDRIISQLEKINSYVKTFPVILESDKIAKTWQWRFEYTDEQHNTILLTISDISKKTEYGYDALTGMLGRRGFDKMLKAKLDEVPRQGYLLMEVDFDNYYLINEKLGFSEGDRLIRRFGAGLRRKGNQFGKECLMAHLEGEHFFILVSSEDKNVTPEGIYREINDLAKSYTADYELKLRMGVYKIEDPSISTNIMYDSVRIALKASKSRKDTGIVYYSDGIKDKMLEEQLLSAEFQSAVDGGQFEVWFQPQVNHGRSGELVGAEALVRWNHPTRGMISPAVFVPVFESNGLVYKLDKFVWRKTCEYIRRWLDEGEVAVPISVNVSRHDIANEDFFETLQSLVDEYRVPLDMIHFEITESAFAENVGVVFETMKKLIEKGFFVSIDDFGSGYSSLSMLKDVPAQMLKLDMRFFAKAGDAARNKCVIESVVRMAKLLGMSVIAEGVEEKKQADFLASAGCRYIQGYLYSKPLPYDEYLRYARENAKKDNAADQIAPPQTEMPNSVQVQDLFRNIISRTNDVIIVADIHTKQLLYANSEAERYYGKVFDPIETTTCSAFCEHSLCDNCPAESLKKGEQKQITLHENDRYMLAHFARIEWNGHDAHVLYQTDITNEMRESERANSMIRNIPAAMIVFDVNDGEEPKLTYISEQTLKLLEQDKASKDNIVLEDCLNRIHPDDVERVRRVAALCLLEKKEFHEEFRLRRKIDGYIWVELVVNPVEEKDGKYRFYGIYKDISERKNFQARTDALIKSIPVPMTIYSVNDGSITGRVFISESARQILGVSEDTYARVGMDELYSRVHPDDLEHVYAVTSECFANKKPFKLQFRVRNGSGAYRWVQIESTPIMRTDSECYFYSIFTDIEAEKMIEREQTEKHEILSTQGIINEGLRQSMRLDRPEDSIAYILEYVGKAIQGERVYVFEKNADGTDNNTFEWAAEGIAPEKDNLQNVPDEVTAPWYDHFRERGALIISDIEDIREEYPRLYETLEPQGIKSLVVAPFFNDSGTPMGFLGVDNPPEENIRNMVSLVQTIAYFIEAALKRRNLERQQSEAAHGKDGGMN